MDFNLNVTGSERALGAQIRKMYKAGKNFLVAHYTPSKEFGEFSFARVSFPLNKAGRMGSACRTEFYCDFSEESLLIVYRMSLESNFPEVAQFNRRFFVDRAMINWLITKRYEDDGISW